MDDFGELMPMFYVCTQPNPVAKNFDSIVTMPHIGMVLLKFFKLTYENKNDPEIQ